jgi:hypothetical protein
LLTEHFDEEEFRTLCFDLSVDYDTLRGEGKAAKARELVAYLDRYDRIDDLVAMGSQMRAHLAWGSMPTVVGENAFAVQRIPPERLRRDFGSELRTLAKQGFVDKSTVVPGGWQVRPAALLWWLAGEAGWINGGALPLVDAVARGAGVG